MPHQCTGCGRVFDDGSKEMLSGCPDCGGNKFQFKPGGTTSDDTPDRETTGQTATDRETTDRGTTASGSGTTDQGDTDRTLTDRTPTDEEVSPSTTPNDVARSGSGSPPETTASTDGTTDPDRGPADSDSERLSDVEGEDAAQADARSDVVSPDELDRASRDVAESDRADSAEGDDRRPEIEELRDELNDQFESIRIVSPGQYELNLMELYDRQEYIISLQEDGRYVIEMPDAWGVTDE